MAGLPGHLPALDVAPGQEQRDAAAGRALYLAAAEGAWAPDGSLLLGRTRRSVAPAFSAAPWLWLGGTALILLSAGWLAGPRPRLFAQRRPG
jgi:hypothetical protein